MEPIKKTKRQHQVEEENNRLDQLAKKKQKQRDEINCLEQVAMKKLVKQNKKRVSMYSRN